MIRFKAVCKRRVRRGVMTLGLVLALGMPPRGARAACTGDCNGDGEVTVDELLTMVNIALGTAPLSTCTTGDADGDGAITVNEIVSAVNNALASCPIVATPTASPTPTPTSTPTPSPGPLGLRHFVIDQATSPFTGVFTQGLPFVLGSFQGQTRGEVGSAFLDLEAGRPDENGFATVDVVGASDYIFAESPSTGLTLCIKPIVPASAAGVIACNGDASGRFNFALTVNHNVGQVGVDGFTAQQCTDEGGSVESPNQICAAGLPGKLCRTNAECATAPGAGDGVCGLSPAACSQPDSKKATACRADADCDTGPDADGVCGLPQPHPGVCNGGFQIGQLGDANDPGTLVLAPLPELGLNGLPVEASIEAAAPCGDEGPGQPIAFALTSAKVRSMVLNFNNSAGICSAGKAGSDCRTTTDCDTTPGAGDGVCGDTLIYDTQGQSFSCTNWQTSSGPGCLVLSAPALDANADGGDTITAFTFCSQ